MARIFVISSQVVRGAVGISIIEPALRRLGHEVLALPTVLLSSHPGHALSAGLWLPPERLAAMVEALDANGWLAGLDAVLTGYLPSRDHVLLAGSAIERIRRASPDVLVVCDPVLGDDPKGLYIDRAAAEAIRDDLLPRATLATPNRFELAFLTGRTVAGIDDAARALMCLPCGGGVATSIPAAAASGLANVAALDDCIAATRVVRRDVAPHGTGDLLAAVLLHGLVAGDAPAAALARATAATDAALDASAGQDVLRLPAVLDQSLTWPVENWSRGATAAPPGAN